MKVLVTYASVYGATRQVARRIGDRLCEARLHVDVLACDEVTAVGGYDAVVVGSAVYDRTWPAPALRFLRNHSEALATRPTWAFSVGVPARLQGAWKDFADRESAVVLARFADVFRPGGHEMFAGVLAREHLPWRRRWLFRAAGGRYGDFRDWEAIDRWANGIGRTLAEQSTKG
ncbi:flavodoxin [Streptomyces sp. SID8379]|uniref:flavodoxin domain-containing protein n=1 Tax=unclassified Streptomyces TaxID=2593676 RepID=UPI00037A98AD|nr:MULTISPECIES: flavodoxin domain-containing protein [unclassified Streptomyces]MYW62624.1 flavodoxin [Streptomyces sp. SID8379]